MGLIYSYQVFVDPARAPDLFTGLVPMLEPEGVTELRFGGGRTVNLPCTSLFEEDRTIVVDGGEDSIDAFDLDLVMRFDGIEEPIGYVYGTYDVVDALWRFSFSAATSRMSFQFEDAPQIRAGFAALAKACGAKRCVLHRENQPEVVIT